METKSKCGRFIALGIAAILLIQVFAMQFTLLASQPLLQISSSTATADPGDEITITISMQDYNDQTAQKISAMQIDLMWDGNAAVYAADSFDDQIHAGGIDIHTRVNSEGGLLAVYEPQTVGTVFPNKVTDVFRFRVAIPKDAQGTTINFSVKKFALVYEDGSSEALVSDANANVIILEVGVNKAPQAAQPQLRYRFSDRVVLAKQEGYEYSLDNITWQSEPVFDHLSVGTQYSFYQRIAATDTVFAGDASEPLLVTPHPEGDLDQSGVVDACDLSLMYKILLGNDTTADITLADINRDMFMDIRDLVSMKRTLASAEKN